MGRIFLLLGILVATQNALAAEAEQKHRIAGIVMEVRAGTPDVVVILCDQKTGLPLSAATKRPFVESFEGPRQKEDALKLFTAVSGPRGDFVFENIPAGEYRVVAQKWNGPFKGVFEINGTAIQLFGSASHIRVPSPEAEKVVLRPAGKGILVLDQNVGNSETLLVLSTKPLAGDPILGYYALGKEFLANTVGVNRMPYGRTTVLGLPAGEVHAFFFAADNSPGFAAKTYHARPLNPEPRVPFIAMWSDGQKQPPPRIRQVMNLMEKHHLSADALLGVKADLKGEQRNQAYRRLCEELDRKIDLPGGETTIVAEVLAAKLYGELLEFDKQRREQAK